MDLSRLPKISGDREPPSTPAGDTTGAPIDPPMAARPPGGFAEAWLGVAIGTILLLLSPRLFQYLLTPQRFQQAYKFTDAQGHPLSYPQTVFFWGDVVVVAFALTLIVEGLVLGFARQAAWVAIAILFTAMVAAANLAYVVFMMWGGYGLQLYSAVAVALGVYACLILAQRYRDLRSG
jgi:hypothetical protein